MYEKYVEIRDSRKLTDYRVSEDTGITKSTFSDWKSGRSKPKMEKLKILADYFGVSIEYFLEQCNRKVFDKHDFEAEEEVKVIMRIKIIFHITRMDDVSDVLKKAEELKKENPHTEISIEVLIQKDYFFLISMAFNPVVEIV